MLAIRPVDDEDALAVWVEVANAITPDEALTVDERRQIFATLPRNRSFVAYDGNVAVGAAMGLFHPGSPHPTLRNLVRPEARRRGIGRALLEAVSDWARTEGATHFEARADDNDPDGIEFALHRNFREVSREIKAILELKQVETPEMTPPRGIEILTWADRPELARGLYDVYAEATPDIPGETEEIESHDDWLAHHMRGPGDRADATFVAVHVDEVVGYAKLSLTDAQPETAYHDLTGVKRAWRGRGIARALKATQIAWAKQAGYTRLSTRNEERNTPIRRLNERFGYRRGPEQIMFRGPVA